VGEGQDEIDQSDFIFLLPSQLELMPDKFFDLFINISSFHEMTRAQINLYYSIIERKAAHLYTKQWLFWQNPDDNISAPAVIYPTRASWDLVAARRHPFHTDFFEAIFKIV